MEKITEKKTAEKNREKTRPQFHTEFQAPIKRSMKIGDYWVRPGIFEVNGARIAREGVNFTLHTHHGTAVELLLYHRGDEEPYAIIPIPEEYKIGDVYSIFVFDLDIEDLEYAYHIDGPYNPKAGFIYDKRKIILDPYARAVVSNRKWGEECKEGYRARVVRNVFDWGSSLQSKKNLCDLIIYEMHVRNFTQHKSSGVHRRGTFAGLQEKIPYLKELGVNAVELLPIFEFDEAINKREINGNVLLEAWGYNTVGFFAPNSRYTASKESNHEGAELKRLIKALHDNGIEVILDVVFNHTAEGNEKGPCFSFKGIDNRVYYMLTPDGNYYNFSGCGNTLNCNHPIVQQMILECLRYWTVHYRVDGFRFDLASILGRNEDGSPMSNPPLLRTLAYDPILSNVKLIAEAWDAGGMYQVGSFPANKRWAEWNGRYRDALRSYLKGEAWEAREAAERISGSRDLYEGQTTSYMDYNSSVNFLTCHDGFTMYDLYAYNEKHNEANGWNNTDGANDNRSWNCGIEGDTWDAGVNHLRYRMIRNAITTLMCSRGTPMFLSGDEFGNTQYGNNNSYCQDNEISWLDWSLLEKNRDLFEFFKFVIAYRKNHPVISRKLPDAVCGLERRRTFGANGNDNNIPEHSSVIGVFFSGYDQEKGRDDMVCMFINNHWEDAHITLPELRYGAKWYLSVNTFGDGNGKYTYSDEEGVWIDNSFVMRPRSVAVFTAKLY